MKPQSSHDPLGHDPLGHDPLNQDAAGHDPLGDEPRGGDPAAFLLEAFLPYQLSIAANRSSRLFAQAYSRAFGLSIAQWRVLAVVGRFGAITPGTVAERTEMDKVKVSRAATSLIAAGLLTQAPDATDRRVHRLSLSAAGARVHAAIVPLARALEGELAAGLTAAEWASLHACLGKLSAHIRILEAAHRDDTTP